MRKKNKDFRSKKIIKKLNILTLNEFPKQKYEM